MGGEGGETARSLMGFSSWVRRSGLDGETVGRRASNGDDDWLTRVLVDEFFRVIILWDSAPVLGDLGVAIRNVVGFLRFERELALSESTRASTRGSRIPPTRGSRIPPTRGSRSTAKCSTTRERGC